MSLKITLELTCLSCVTRVLAYRNSHNPWRVKGQEGSEATTCHSAPSPALATQTPVGHRPPGTGAAQAFAWSRERPLHYLASRRCSLMT